MDLKNLLDKEYKRRNNTLELSYDKPDPLLIARNQTNHYAILLCALYGYGNASLIVKFLNSLDFNILTSDENTIKNSLQNRYYRFQNRQDVIKSFLVLSMLSKEYDLEEIFYKGYKKEHNILDGIDNFIDTLYGYSQYKSYGYNFLFGKKLKRDKYGVISYKQNAPYKRYNMFLRWMVRDDNLDLGLWKKIDKKDLLLPLDTHTFNVSKKINLLKNGNYNLGSVIEITNRLKGFDIDDPIKYDFALYRLGQEKQI